MGKPRGFLEIRRSKATYRPVTERVHDYQEFELPPQEPELRDQAARCMDCGIPFCHQGCPLGNLIPEWNDLVMAGRWEDAVASLHSTNNFPEVTGRVCPAPCEASCTLNIYNVPVNIKLVERSVGEYAIAHEMLKPQRAQVRSGRRVAVVGSGPAGLACAQQLARKGHDVVVYEKADRVGGLLRYGIPDFKLDKAIIDRRVEQMEKEGVVFKTGVDCGVDVTGEELRKEFDAIVLCGGAMKPRDLEVPGRELKGVHFAMDFLRQQNKRVAGDVVPDDEAILATGKKVVVLGGGDTGSDCIGTSHRQGATSVLSLEIMPKPPEVRRLDNPWPAWPLIYRTSSSHEEGGEREFGVMTRGLLGDDQGRLRAVQAVRVELVVDPATKASRFEAVAGSEFEIPCDLLFLAMGFVGSSRVGLLSQLGVELDKRGNVAHQNGLTNVPAVFAAGDMARGQSLVVWAIAEGRQVADRVDAMLDPRQGRQVA